MTAERIDSARSVFGQHLRAVRTDRGYTQAEVAAKISVAQTTIANYEQGTRFPEEVTLRRLADLFEVSIDWLLGRSPLPAMAAATPPAEHEKGAESPTVDAYIAALLSGNPGEAARIIDGLEKGGWSTRKIYCDLFEPALRVCGLRWTRGEMDIAQEHLVTHLTEVFMAQLFSRTPLPARREFSLLGVTILGDLHNIGVRMVCDFLELEGWTCYYLGADLPTESIVGAVAKMKPSVLALSATVPSAVESVSVVVGALRRSPKYPGTAVMVGGGAFNAQPSLWRQVGADAWAGSAVEAVECAKRLVGDEPENMQFV